MKDCLFAFFEEGTAFSGATLWKICPCKTDHVAEAQRYVNGNIPLCIRFSQFIQKVKAFFCYSPAKCRKTFFALHYLAQSSKMREKPAWFCNSIKGDAHFGLSFTG